MRNWGRIIVTALVLVGGTALFGYWSLSQFEDAFEDVHSVYRANTLSAASFFNRKNDAGVASTSSELPVDIATSTASVATSTEPNLVFTFPRKKDNIFIGCTYPISWQASTTITFLETTLVDAGTKETVGPKTGGLKKGNDIESDVQSLAWKVGSVWPGEYYISISKVNETEAEIKSGAFSIHKMPENATNVERAEICTESNGSI